MTTIPATNALPGNAGRTNALAGTARPAAATGFASLGQKDFLTMLTAELKQQDPFSPVDQKEMLAQMAQFTSLAGVTEGNATLKAISGKLDALIAAQLAATASHTPAQET